MPVGYRQKRAPFPKGARGFQLQGVSIPNRIRKAPTSGGEAQSGRLHEGMAEGMPSSGGRLARRASTSGGAKPGGGARGSQP